MTSIMKRNASKKTEKKSDTLDLTSEFTSGGFITTVTISKKINPQIGTSLILNLEEIKDLKDFLETLL